ncbi:DUF1289 domain-containing protein [Vibrio sagamiensis]|uniref:DUF1289 domain-containing protein n=1 Tax=Vibrio sagamiensis NBRC 104589 TaxID=1219064 RepID=A0A511QHY0_9VIBR|nr:DUF1289 domain-containing protein [Vibrio sagamiensis]PNQ68831.1 DUF1289 domain-containing protein [Vibrio agarivorans]GEM76920.1 DUF1289 domain-containing protein [Vibrio sagamiensis NBRC 104589]
MEQLEFFTVPNPCVGVCTTDEKGYCRGCMRNRNERFNWLSFTPVQQRHVIRLCRQRYMKKVHKGNTITEPQKNSISPQQELFE